MEIVYELAEDKTIFQAQMEISADAHTHHLIYPVAKIFFQLIVILRRNLVLGLGQEPIGRTLVELGHGGQQHEEAELGSVSHSLDFTLLAWERGHYADA